MKFNILYVLKNTEFELKNIEISSLEKVNFEKIKTLKQISDIQLGKDFISLDAIIFYIKNVDFTIITACYKKEIVGFCILENSTFEKIENSIKKHLFLKNEAQEKSIILLKTIAISPKFSRKGIGRKIIQTIDLQKEKTNSTLISVAWKSKKGIHIEKLFLEIEMQKIIEIENYWSKDSLEKNYSCKNCGKPPCKCTATIFHKV